MNEADDDSLVLITYKPILELVDSDDDSEDDFVEATACAFYAMISEDESERLTRKKRVTYIRIDMAAFMQQYIDDPSFDRTIRMNRLTFKHLVSLLEPALEINNEMASRRGGAITPDMCVYLTLRYLAGGKNMRHPRESKILTIAKYAIFVAQAVAASHLFV